VLVEGKPVLRVSPGDLGVAATQAPQGPVIWASVQAKVLAT
jgi:hypothetical protein